MQLVVVNLIESASLIEADMTSFDWAIIAALASAKVGFLIGLIAGRFGAGRSPDSAPSDL
jgi:hypothetical protein